jgi:hypothetical protein
MFSAAAIELVSRDANRNKARDVRRSTLGLPLIAFRTVDKRIGSIGAKGISSLSLEQFLAGFERVEKDESGLLPDANGLCQASN